MEQMERAEWNEGDDRTILGAFVFAETLDSAGEADQAEILRNWARDEFSTVTAMTVRLEIAAKQGLLDEEQAAAVEELSRVHEVLGNLLVTVFDREEEE